MEVRIQSLKGKAWRFLRLARSGGIGGKFSGRILYCNLLQKGLTKICRGYSCRNTLKHEDVNVSVREQAPVSELFGLIS